MTDTTQQPPEVFTFITGLPTACKTVEQMKCLIKIRFQRELDEYFDAHPEIKIQAEDQESE